MDEEIHAAKDLILAETILKITAIENLIVKSGLLKAEDIVIEMKRLAGEVSNFINETIKSDKNQTGN